MITLTITDHEYRSLRDKHLAAQSALARFQDAFAGACHARNIGEATFVSVSPTELKVTLPEQERELTLLPDDAA